MEEKINEPFDISDSCQIRLGHKHERNQKIGIIVQETEDHYSIKKSTDSMHKLMVNLSALCK